jgi:hypothetical protein
VNHGPSKGSLSVLEESAPLALFAAAVSNVTPRLHDRWHFCACRQKSGMRWPPSKNAP